MGSELAKRLASHGDVVQLRCTSKRMRQLVDGCAHTLLLGFLGRGIELRPHQLADLQHMRVAEDPNGWSFGDLRGGVLADAPGLGKTVTMVALILSSMGTLPKTPSSFWDAARLREGWATLRCNPVAKVELLPMLVRLQQSRCTVPSDLLDFVAVERPPADSFATVGAFESAVRGVAQSAPEADRALLGEVLRKRLIAMRCGLDPKNRSTTHGPHGLRALFERELWPVSTTLIIVPKPLLQHWAEQLRLLLDLRTISHQPGGQASGRGAVWVDDLGATRDLADVDPDLPVPCHGGASAAKLLDEPGLAATFAKYAIVVTSFERCASEAKRADEWSEFMWAADEARRSPLTALRWLRLVVDEGHALGGGAEAESISSRGANRFIAGLAAERRWVLSGTPTVGSSEKDALSQLHRLLAFLREPEFGLVPPPQWNTRMGAPFLGGAPSAEPALLRLLRPIMVRHTKEDIDLPDPRVLRIEWDGRSERSADGEQAWDKSRLSERQHVDAVFRGAAERVLARVVAARKRASACRPVKAIVYAEGKADLEQFQHFLVQGWAREHGVSLDVANEAVALHYVSNGRDYRASELGRFRHNKLRCRECPRCGLLNDEHDASDRCARPLINVRFDPVAALEWDEPAEDPLAGREVEVEEERVYFPTAPVPGAAVAGWLTGWRPWAVSDFYRHDLYNQRVRVQGDARVDGSTLPAVGGGTRECTLLGYTRCKTSLSGRPLVSRQVDAPVMLLCADGSHGLDLSFVTHIFLLGRVEDAAIKQQVVSRADRMGARGDADGRGCEVETLRLWHDDELSGGQAQLSSKRRRGGQP
jgi:hypothetical protein